MAPDQVKGQLDVLLLRVLLDGPAHGYSVISSLRERSEGTFDLPEGTIYPALHRLEEAGFLDSDWESVNGRRRRLYRLTRSGAAALVEGQSRWANFVAAVESVLTPVSPRPV